MQVRSLKLTDGHVFSKSAKKKKEKETEEAESRSGRRFTFDLLGSLISSREEENESTEPRGVNCEQGLHLLTRSPQVLVVP